MTDQPRDWDKELADIDKMMAKLPAGAEGSTAPAAPARRGGAPAVPAAPAGGRLAVLTTWARVILGLALAVGITQWPYPSACGLNLAVYLGAILTVIVAGFWSGVTSWKRRLGWAHTLSLLVLLWGMVLVAREVLPRAGYARTVAHWTCG
jgi:hypothetical protein